MCAQAARSVRMPAEWAQHEGCLMAWPYRSELWSGLLSDAQDEYAAVARAVAAFEPVLMVTAPGTAAEVRGRFTGERAAHEIEVVELPLDDSWTRDSGPIFVHDETGRRFGADFRFNAWGGKHWPYDSDDKLAALVLDRLGVERLHSGMVLEGGAITVDGEGTLITTEQCLLHPNRNPRADRAGIEAELSRMLGIEKVIWLPYGGLEDTETDGHVDGVAAYIAPGRVVVSLPDDENHPDYARMRANLAVLEATRDAKGRKLDIVVLPQTAYGHADGRSVEVGYLNFYLPNGGCVVPVAGRTEDEEVAEALAKAMPERKVVPVVAPTLAFGGGGVHCITQQIPMELR
ncbi:agmatine/peptidylarginine deiminase [Streptomyces sp. NBC_00859]|uniref:agmatine deiminase family protein n=1 Tax=Streptomyces sp. NBC_00859 TaxID=2903682 RepID=UPI0038666751|nr:agmatine deiminase family protein [Streptomyces sp. NBC_00859]